MTVSEFAGCPIQSAAPDTTPASGTTGQDTTPGTAPPVEREQVVSGARSHQTLNQETT